MPLAALAVVGRREQRARRVLGLAAPARARRLPLVAATIAVPVLLGVSATQPILRGTTSLEVRTDADALFVIDISRSMLAARSPGARTRITRARNDAIRLRSELSGIPSGVATMTDHVLPDLLPITDPAVFDQTVRGAVRIEEPPPSSPEVIGTSLASLGSLGTQDFFPPAARHRIAIVLTDGESRQFDVQQTAHALDTAPGVTPIFVHVWSSDETVFDADGKAETEYRIDPGSGQALSALAQAAGGKSFDEQQLGQVVAAARAAVGSGPTRREGRTVSTRALAPYIALAALVPLLLLLFGSRILGAAQAFRAARPAARVPGTRARRATAEL